MEKNINDEILSLNKLKLSQLTNSSEMLLMSVLRNRRDGKVLKPDNQYLYWSAEQKSYITEDQKREHDDFLLYNKELKNILF